MELSNVYVLLLLTCVQGPSVTSQETPGNDSHTPQLSQLDPTAEAPHPTDLVDQQTYQVAHPTDEGDHEPDQEDHEPDQEDHEPDQGDPQPDQEDHQPDQGDHQPDQEDHQPDHKFQPADHEDHPPRHGPGHWSYTDETEWSKGFPDCGGRHQSPINVDTGKTRYDPTLTEIILSGYDVSPAQSMGLKNNGHTVVLQLPDNLRIVSGLPDVYEAKQLHFHWGSREHPGSEHTVNGHKFPGEIHIVHFSTMYKSLDAAVTQPGGLAVLAAFIQEGPEDNGSYEHLLAYLAEVKDAGQSADIPGFDIRGLLPQRLDRYYRYNGSLTTPPCYQTVNWTIFNQTIFLSAKQLAVLEDTIHHDHGDVLQMNFREPQNLNGRLVLSSFRAPVGGRKVSSGDPGSPVITSDTSDSDPPDTGARGAENTALGTGDMLAIIFGVLFGVTAVAFFAYIRQNQRRKQRSSDNKPNVIYKAATTEENAV